MPLPRFSEDVQTPVPSDDPVHQQIRFSDLTFPQALRSLFSDIKEELLLHK
jgi:hypothetical protein